MQKSARGRKYLNTTINAINELIDEYGGLSTEQDKEIRKQRKFLWDNRSEFDEFEVLENCSQIALEEKTYANKINKLRTLERQLKSPYFARLDFKEEGEEGESFYIGLLVLRTRIILIFMFLIGVHLWQICFMILK